jgi:hypothetical protein
LEADFTKCPFKLPACSLIRHGGSTVWTYQRHRRLQWQRQRQSRRSGPGSNRVQVIGAIYRTRYLKASDKRVALRYGMVFSHAFITDRSLTNTLGPGHAPRAITHSQAQQQRASERASKSPGPSPTLIIFTIICFQRSPRSILSNRRPDILDHNSIEKLRIDREVRLETGRSHRSLLSSARSLSSWTSTSRSLPSDSHPLDILR